MTDTASGMLGKECCRKTPLVTRDVFDHCDERRNLKKKQYGKEEAKRNNAEKL